MANDVEEETTALRRALEAYVAWEFILGGDGWPAVDPASRTLRSAPAVTGPDASLAAPLPRLQVLAEEAAACTRCALHAPLAGEAGALLDRMIVAMGLTPDASYVCSVVKCALPDDDALEVEEREACTSHLANQLDAVRPEVIVALGEDAARALIGPLASDTRWRGVWRMWQGVPVMPTHAPADVLAEPGLRRPVWEDLQAVMARLGLRR